MLFCPGMTFDAEMAEHCDSFEFLNVLLRILESEIRPWSRWSPDCQKTLVTDDNGRGYCAFCAFPIDTDEVGRRCYQKHNIISDTFKPVFGFYLWCKDCHGGHVPTW